MNLRKQIIDGTRWLSFSSVFLIGGYFIVFGILFHLVSPKEFAVFSLAQAVVSLALNIIAPTFGNAIVFKETLTERQFSSVYWLNILIGIALGLVVYCTGRMFEGIFQSNGLEKAINIISLTLPLAAIGQPYWYLLQRHELFRKLSIIRVIVFLPFATVALFGSWKGYGTDALIWAFVAQTFVESALMFWYGRRIHKPLFVMEKGSIMFFAKFGIYQGGERFVDTLASQVDTFLIGRLLGMESLGVYEAVKRILIRPLNLVSDAIEGVMFPVMAKRQQEPLVLVALFLQNVKYLGLLCFMPYLLAAFLARPLSELFLGISWPNAAFVFCLFALIMLFRIPRMPTDALIMARGKPKWWLIWKCAQLVLTIIFIVVGLNWGIEGGLYSLLLLQIFLWLLNYQFLLKKLAPIF